MLEGAARDRHSAVRVTAQDDRCRWFGRGRRERRPHRGATRSPQRNRRRSSEGRRLSPRRACASSSGSTRSQIQLPPHAPCTRTSDAGPSPVIVRARASAPRAGLSPGRPEQRRAPGDEAVGPDERRAVRAGAVRGRRSPIGDRVRVDGHPSSAAARRPLRPSRRPRRPRAARKPRPTRSSVDTAPSADVDRDVRRTRPGLRARLDRALVRSRRRPSGSETIALERYR